MSKKFVFAISVMALLTACNGSKSGDTALSDNPLLTKSTLFLEAPDFDKIKTEHFMPAFKAGMEQHLAEIDSIVNNTEAPTFENTLVAMERSGQTLTRVSNIFFNLTSANTNDDLQKIEEEVSPLLAAHSDAIYLNDKLFARVKAVYEGDKTGIDAEGLKLIQEYYDRFVRSGANLNAEDKAKLMELNKEEATLSTDFGNKLITAGNAAAVIVSSKDSLDGLTEAEIAKAADDAKAAGKEGKYLINITNTTQQDILASLNNRTIRQRVLDASLYRTEKGDSNDTQAIVLRLAKLRAQKARLLGFPNYAAWKLQNQMAKTPETVLAFIKSIATPYAPSAQKDAAALQAYAKAQGLEGDLTAADWSYYANKMRKEKYGLDENEVKQYFVTDSVLKNGVFFMAQKLYGLTFKERNDLPVYAEDVRVFDVIDHDGKQIGLFYTDLYRRPTKSGGAWMSNWVEQSHLLGQKPVIYNVCNYTKGTNGQPSLINFDEVTTLFHEFGHALHGMFANQQYPSLSGTNVARDFVEMPSQIHEHFAMEPEVFANYAKHWKTQEPMPADLVQKIKDAAGFNQAYALGENLAAVSLDLAWHSLTVEEAEAITDVAKFEEEALRKVGLYNPQIPPRYRSSYFRHIWSNGYASGYYAYLWSEVLDNNAYQWMVANGGMKLENGQRLRDMILSRGNTQDFNTIFTAFTGLQKPDIKDLLRARGLQ